MNCYYYCYYSHYYFSYFRLKKKLHRLSVMEDVVALDLPVVLITTMVDRKEMGQVEDMHNKTRRESDLVKKQMES